MSVGGRRGGVAGCYRGSPSVCWRERVKHGLGRAQVDLRWNHLNWTNREGSEGWDKMARITTEKSCSGRQSAAPDWQSIMVSEREPALDKKYKEWVS